MKKRTLVILSALFVFGLVAVATGYNRILTAQHTVDLCCAVANCCQDGKCKMRGACCQNHDACPVKNKENADVGIDLTNVVVAGDTENCCAGDAACCHGGACCRKEKSAG